jgi:hypothetical protein
LSVLSNRHRERHWGLGLRGGVEALGMRFGVAKLRQALTDSTCGIDVWWSGKAISGDISTDRPSTRTSPSMARATSQQTTMVIECASRKVSCRGVDLSHPKAVGLPF